MSARFPLTYVLLSTKVASSSATIDFTSVITSTWKTYAVLMRRILPATDAVNLQMLYSTDNGATWLATNYKYTSYRAGSSALGALTSSDGTTSFLLRDAISNVSNYGLNLNLMLFNLNTTHVTQYYGFSADINATETVVDQYSGVQNSTTAVNAVRFQMSSGNIASGTFYIYGVNEP